MQPSVPIPMIMFLNSPHYSASEVVLISSILAIAYT